MALINVWVVPVNSVKAFKTADFEDDGGTKMATMTRFLTEYYVTC